MSMKRAPEMKLSQILSPFFPTRLHLRNDLHLARKAWHMMMGLVIVGVYLSGMTRSTAVLTLSCILGLDILIETARLNIPAFNEKVVRYWGALMRSCEVNRLSGIPYYLSASVLAIAIFPKPIAALSIVYLACGDPIASLFGIMYGNRSIRFANGKSLIGTGAGILTCALATVVFLGTMGIHGLNLAILTVVGSVAGGAAEMLPLEVDDNFSIPMVSGFTLWLAFILLGI